jgi:sugar lactone lactonase YvrE
MKQSQVIEKRRLVSPATTPQALAWDSRNKKLWIGSRDLRRIYVIDPESGRLLKQQEAPGIPWAAVAQNGELRFTIGEGADDDRYIYRYTPEAGFSKMFACPEFTGSYLSFDGKNLYMSQWHMKRVLKSSARLTWAPKSAVTPLQMARSTFCEDRNSRTKAGESHDSIRKRKRRLLKISPSCHSRRAH